jgi:hypothetical protein
MKPMKTTCPACGVTREWRIPLPETSTCGNCKSVFSPASEVQRYAVHICRPGERDSYAELHYYARAPMLPNRGDAILSPYVSLKDGESLRVADVEFEFSSDGEGTAALQSVFLLTAVQRD